MPRKLISFLGTTDYTPCHYYLPDGRNSKLGKFVQSAVLELYGNDWMQEDQIIVCLTKEAKEKNWNDKVVEGCNICGLNSILQVQHPNVSVKVVDIDADQSVEAQWKLFDQIVELIETNDEIYFDVTNAFRTFPIMATMVWNYAKTLRGASLGKILYGNFEALDRETKMAPMIDLAEMASLLEWTIGINQFLRYGNTATLVTMIDEPMSRDLKDAKGQDAEAFQLTKLAKALREFSLALSTCRANRVQPIIQDLKGILNELEKVEIHKLPPLVKLLAKMKEKFEIFDSNSIMDYYYMAHWCCEHDLIQQGITLLSENVVTVICWNNGLNEHKGDIRRDVNSALKIHHDSMPEPLWRVCDNSRVRQLLEHIHAHKVALAFTQDLTNKRNDINHAGGKPGSIKQSDKFKRVLEKILDGLKPYFEYSDEILNGKRKGDEEFYHADRTEQSKREDAGLKMLLLLSHELTDEQRKNARERWNIVSFESMPTTVAQSWGYVPAVGEWNESWLNPVKIWLEEIYESGDIVVVQGEPAATMRMVVWLAERSIPAYYATTKRKVMTEESAQDGSVTSKRVFQHVQFRQYPCAN
ncbi:hypothetical protein JT05_10500 [Desulfosporosinus sp. Tol-M]|nr:hypothetical protein JT05_10500 [Desulfosporosinus sp. Tol-M]